MNIIFLDIDGVLNSFAYFQENKGKGRIEISDFHLQMLAKIYHSCNAKIVLSSSWRELDVPSDIHVYWMYEYLIKELARYNMEIIDKTPYVENNRPLEIKTWLDNHGKYANFVSLDDDWSKKHYDKYGIGEHLVKTNFFCNKISEGGLQQEHVDRAIKILKGGTKTCQYMTNWENE